LMIRRVRMTAAFIDDSLARDDSCLINN